MANSRVVQIDGLRDLGQNLKQLQLETRFKIAEKATKKGAAQFRKEAKSRAPVADKPHQLGYRPDQIAQPGNLKRNIFVRRIKNTNLTSEVEVRVRQGSGKAGKDAFYWLFLEFGTVKMAPRKFMREAYEAAKARAAEDVKKTLKTEIDKTVATLRIKR